MSKNHLPRRVTDSSLGRRHGGLWHVLGQDLTDIALWTLGVLGLLSLLAAVTAYIWGLSIILFSTGSMSPTIPAGSAALVQRIPAASIRVGDVVTVERKDALPVTHRVTSITPSEGSATGKMVITMRGDANASDDMYPYQVSEVRRVLFSVPGVARTIIKFRDPLVLAGLTVVAGCLVTWAFWPRRLPKPTQDGSGRESPDSEDESSSIPAHAELVGNKTGPGSSPSGERQPDPGAGV